MIMLCVQIVAFMYNIQITLTFNIKKGLQLKCSQLSGWNFKIFQDFWKVPGW